MRRNGGPGDFQVAFMAGRGLKAAATASEAIRYNVQLVNLFKFAYYTITEDGKKYSALEYWLNELISAAMSSAGGYTRTRHLCSQHVHQRDRRRVG